ncbi:MAG: DUF1614 domain-containing protein [Methanomassiliicoccales archaeon]|nr:DUF1614 domain-containing protein [Methanomassiliicoccales archaeon]
MSSVPVILASAIASLMIFIVIVLLAAHYTSCNLLDFWVEDSWLESIAYAALIAIAAIFFSFINLKIVDGPPPVSMNITGALVPLLVSCLIIIFRRIKIAQLVISVPTITVLSYAFADIRNGQIVIDFPFWLVISAVAALCAYIFSDEKDLMQASAISYVAASLGAFIGLDVLQLVSIWGNETGEFIFGAGGIIDFVFLAGIIAIAVLWTATISASCVRRIIDVDHKRVNKET